MNDIKFSRREEYRYENEDYIRLDLDHDRFLYYSNKKVENELIINTKLGEDHVCIYTYQNFASSKDYKLMNRNTVRSCSKLPDTQVSDDPRYIPAITIKNRELYEDNQLYWELRSLPKFKFRYFEKSSTLFTRGYLHWADHCVTESGSSKIESISRVLDNYGQIKKYYWATILLYLVMGIINIVTLSKVSSSPVIRYDQVIIGKVVLFLNYSVFSLISRSQQLQTELADFVNVFGAGDCSDSVTNSVLRETLRLFSKTQSIQDTVAMIWRYFIGIIIIFSFVLFVPLIYNMMIKKARLLSL